MTKALYVLEDFARAINDMLLELGGYVAAALVSALAWLVWALMR